MYDTKPDAREHLGDAIFDLGQFLQRHERGLFELIGPDDETTFEACCDLHNEAKRVVAPDPQKINRLLSTVVAALAAQRPSFLEERSRQHKRCMLAENAWYGARLTDRLHLIQLRHAAAGRIAA
ncbi:hypothetical protein [Roseobacter denitrificans]|uniref:hypothetical protein n=1 Tax=Roseobacter denitrificans TaxID=2434 RepID=UPI0008F1B5F0|nr:hypothetical protein [Roseobacter denitrificans]SFG05227.1 hypothetical protein SAMN05443635_106180 [Roseobacter denitrificans OCh 114]